MSLRSNLLTLAAAAVLLAGAIACRSESGTQAVAGARSSPVSPLGPIPGPGSSSPEIANPYGNDPTAAVDGRKLFVRFNCSGCHGGRAGGGMGPSLRDVVWLYGDADAQIFNSITEGRDKGMPAW